MKNVVFSYLLPSEYKEKSEIFKIFISVKINNTDQFSIVEYFRG